MNRLRQYFVDGVSSDTSSMIGMEVETSFVTFDGRPASLQQSQGIFRELATDGWSVRCRKGAFVTEIVDGGGNRLLYELGRQNIELSTAPARHSQIVYRARAVLERLYIAARVHGLQPHFVPILDTTEDLLVIPDERDATWLALDGRAALAPLASISAVQFTVGISVEQAIPVLNRLGESIGSFLADYPQDQIWRRYIRDSLAGYDPQRYGGPLRFADFEGYCQELSRQAVIQDSVLVPFQNAASLDIPLYLRSIWWYFRLRRYGDQLCIEVRPLPRRGDARFDEQLSFVLNTINL